MQLAGGSGLRLLGTLDLRINTRGPGNSVVIGTTTVAPGLLLRVSNVLIRGPPLGELSIASLDVTVRRHRRAVRQRHRHLVHHRQRRRRAVGHRRLLRPPPPARRHRTPSGLPAQSPCPPPSTALAVSGTLAAERNTTGFDVDLAVANGDPIDLAVAAGVTRIGGSLTVVVSTPDGQQLASISGTFAVEQSTAGPDGIVGTADDVAELLVGASGVALELGFGAGSTFTGIRVTNAELILLLTATGFAVDVRGDAELVGVPGVAIGGRVGVQRSTLASPVARQLTVGGRTLRLDLAAGVSRFGGTGVTMTVAGQTLTGTFSVSATATTVDVSFSDVGFSIGDGARPFVSIANGTGSAQITATGFTGTFSGQATVDIPGVAFAGTVTVEIRETGPTATGDFVQVRLGSTGNPVTLSIAGQALTGVFTFEQLTTAAGDQVIRVGAIEVGLSIAGIVTLAGGTAAFVILPDRRGRPGLGHGHGDDAGRHHAPGRVRDRRHPEHDADGRRRGVRLRRGSRRRPRRPGRAVPARRDHRRRLHVQSAGGFTVDASGNLTIERQSRVDGSTVTKIGFSDVEITIGAALGLRVEGQFSAGSGVFVALPTGIAGIFAGTFSGAVGPVSAGGNVRSVSTRRGWPSRSGRPSTGVTPVSFGAAEGDVFKVSVSGASLNIGDFVTIEGDVAIDSMTGTFAGTNLEVFLGQGPARLDDGSINPLATGVLLTDATSGWSRARRPVRTPCSPPARCS